jgi:hypothetical protein
MTYLNSLSPDVLRRLTTEQDSNWTDPATGITYYGQWNPAVAGNDENAGHAAAFNGRIWGETADTWGTDKKYKPGTDMDMARYDPSTGAFQGMETGMYGGSGMGANDWIQALMSAAILGGGAYAAFGGGAGAGAGAEAVGGAGSGWAEALGAEQAMGSMVLDAAPIGAGVGGAGAGVGGGATTAAATGSGGGLLSSAAGALGGAGKWLPGLLGAALGGKGGGVGSGQGGGRELDPRLAPWIYGDDKNPGALNWSFGLLNKPVAPNGFERFYGG